MQPSPPPNQVPLVVDMDGTLLKTDLIWEFLARILRRNPFVIFAVLVWWMRGRAFLKKKLGARAKVDPVTLPYNEKFLRWLREQKSAGRRIILATAADSQMALPVANYVGIFDEVLSSDGKTNLRSKNKLKLLAEKFGERGFDYAGNSTADLAVWSAAREAIVVNASPSLLKRAAQSAKIGQTFLDGYSPFTIPGRFLDELFVRSGYLTAMTAGILLALAFPKSNIAGFAWIAPALLVFAAQSKSTGDAFRVGYVGGLAFWLATLYWLLLIPAPGYPILGWLALSALQALFFAAWLCLINWRAEYWSLRLLWSLSGAAVWVALEMVRARILGGFPWNFIGVSQFQMTPLIQIASVTGVYGVSFLVVWASLSLYSAVRMIFVKPDSRFAWQPEIFLPLFVVAALFAWGELRMTGEQPPPGTWSLTLIQPSIPQTLIWDETANSNRFQQLLTMSDEALTNQSDLLLWPESAVPELTDAAYDAITNFAGAHHVWLLFNADDVVPKPGPPNDQYDVFNAAFLIDPDGNLTGIYHKQKLVMFGEYIPLATWIPIIKWFTPITGSYQAGNEPVQFALIRRDGMQVELSNSSPASAGQIIWTSPLICFEDMFPQLARRATRRDTDFLVNLTNDGWFDDSAEQWQHMAGALYRTIENGIPLVRCCNNGVTCWIDGFGRVREIFRDQNGTIYGPGAMTIDVPIQPHLPTFYNRHGDWFGWSCVGIGLLVFAARIYCWRSRK
ncbi:MAG TPA: apolipoprotein N-acyltransferase [Verrucomicrobiae bacterium]|nr:apolipoprotein N-acyltransferase [Verrucomicrobiae bacterium]